MHVSSKTILERMEAELTKAQQLDADDDERLRSIANIKMLCELLLQATDEHREPARTEPEFGQEQEKTNTQLTEMNDKHVIHAPSSIFDF